MKIDKFSEALQSRNPDNHLVKFFNDMYDEHEQREQYISDLEYTDMSKGLKHTSLIQLLAECKRLREGVIRNIKQMRYHKGYKSVLVKGGKCYA